MTSLRDELASAIRAGCRDLEAQMDEGTAADSVVALLREGPWFDEAAERMRHCLIYDILGAESPDRGLAWVMAEARLGYDGITKRLLLAALGEDTE